MSEGNTLQLSYPEGFDDRAAMEMRFKGWIKVRVAVPGGAVYELMFVDSARLTQDLEVAAGDGWPCYAEPGLVLVPEVTTGAVEEGVRWLWREGYFGRLKPVET